MLVGLPVREAIEIGEGYGADTGPRVKILVIGGSQGAFRLNRIVLEGLESLFSRLDAEVIIQWGKWSTQGIESYTERFKERLWIAPFIEDMGWAYTWADVIVSRCGASSLAELAIVGKPAILVPFPFATHDHQAYNAKAVQETKAAIVIEEKALTPKVLVNALLMIAKDSMLRESMRHAWKTLARPRAQERILDSIEASIKGEKRNVPAEPDAILPGNRRYWDERNRRASLEP
jgi:UDP-N-acetylglucosamine--N-acetylmuramyl-(pentapeptide) pyrophosphoryl-undecaprenol N-acetylglucosamine transferase